MAPSGWLQHLRTVRFGDTDAAGVMHFHQLLRWCHEAYEESLETFGLPSAAIFPSPSWDAPCTGSTDSSSAQAALPIVHCSADYLAPLVCGDRLTVSLSPQQLDAGSYEVSYIFTKLEAASRPAALGLTRHVAIDPISRRRCDLPGPIKRWLEASASGISAS
ncbi:acyl-CoA thioesterase [Synechococcus sp. J7-Johnson]|uniref:acyl-CoA thioesterase n=1 Tax=Synechococcus sp. J7-Johnson TaxID=2823737 RepID=UPI0020CFA1F1|nr:thioesterase family protein [Synechococcus sp. J7-Johnson]MCP9839112.1 acyl-CoA thioesterase [Synechococcus sp. J7-Johnson]